VLILRLANPYLAVIVGVIGVSSSAIFVKLTTAPSVITAGYRLLFTFLMLLPFTLKYNRKDFRFFSGKQYRVAFISGLFLAFHFISWFSSLNYTSVASSTVLVNTQPLFVIIFSYLLWREKLPLKALIGVSIAFGGTVILSWGDFCLGPTNLWGDALALIGAIMVAGYYLCGKYLRQTMSLLPYTTLVYGFSTLLLFFFALLGGYSFTNYSLQDFLIFLALAFFCTIMGHSLLNWAIKFLPASSVSISILGEPVIASALAYFLFQETLTLQQLIGSILILGGILFYHYSVN